MYSTRDKIVKKGKAPATETEDEVVKALFELQNSTKDEVQADIKVIQICRAQILTEGEQKVLLIAVPFPQFPKIKKHHKAIIAHLEAKFKVPVVIVAQRTILSKYGKVYHNKYRKEKGITEKTNEPHFKRCARRLLGRHRKQHAIYIRFTHSKSSERDSELRLMEPRSTRSTSRMKRERMWSTS
jgi:hypothetical protein